MSSNRSVARRSDASGLVGKAARVKSLRKLSFHELRPSLCFPASARLKPLRILCPSPWNPRPLPSLPIATRSSLSPPQTLSVVEREGKIESLHKQEIIYRYLVGYRRHTRRVSEDNTNGNERTRRKKGRQKPKGYEV